MLPLRLYRNKSNESFSNEKEKVSGIVWVLHFLFKDYHNYRIEHQKNHNFTRLRLRLSVIQMKFIAGKYTKIIVGSFINS